MQEYHPWLPLSRDITKLEFFKHPDSVSLFGLLFSMASCSESVTEGAPLMVGQLRINYSFLRDYFNASTQNIRTRMERLKKANVIFVDGSHRHYMLVTIRHFNDSIFAAASNKGGWVKFFNEVTNFQWFRDSIVATVYIDILCRCYSTDSDEGYNISITSIVKDTGIACTKIIEAIMTLQKEGVVNVGSRRGRDLISISFANNGLCLPEDPFIPLPPRSQHTTNTPSTHQNGVNKSKNGLETASKTAVSYLRDKDIDRDKYITQLSQVHIKR